MLHYRAMNYRKFLPLLLLAALLPAAVHAAPRCFAETGACIDGRLRTFWETQGGLAVFGLPLGAPYTTADGFAAQRFERARLELHPQNRPPYDVLLGRLGADALGAPPAPPAPETPQPGCRFFAETQLNLCPPFLGRWSRDGLDLGSPDVSPEESLALFGLPLTPPRVEQIEGRPTTVQWFERARMEDHGAQGVLLGRLGAEQSASAAPQQPALARGGFIQARGSDLTRLGQAIVIKGVNYYPQGRPWREMWSDWDPQQIAAELRVARDDLGINTVRILLPYNITGDGGQEGRVSADLLRKLREMVQVAGDLDLRVIIALFDFYQEFPPAGSAEEARNVQYLTTLIGNFVGDDRIIAWDLHNEPDHYSPWKDGNSGAALSWLGRMADVVHRLAPNHLVTVGPGLYENLWLPGPDGRRIVDFTDVISVHNYNAADMSRQLDEVRRRTNKPLLLGEFGWPTGPRCAVHGYDETTQAQTYRDSLAAAQGRVAGVLAWTLRDFDAGPSRRWDTREEHYGLYRADGTRKPAADALRAFAAAPLPAQFATALPLTDTAPGPDTGESGAKRIPGTGFYIKNAFRRTWDLWQGPSSFGPPLSEATLLRDDKGNERVVQYFANAVLQLNPRANEAPDYPTLDEYQKAQRDITVLNLGEATLAARGIPIAVQPVAPELSRTYTLLGAKWRFGEAITPLLSEQIDGAQARVQYFQRGRLELLADGTVRLAPLGSAAWQTQCRSVEF